MTNYFDWETADYVTKAFEIKNRNHIAGVRSDYDIPCFIRGCGRKPKRGERVYKPIASPGTQNKVIAHVDCVDRVCAENSAKAGGANGNGNGDVKARVFDALKRKPAKPFAGLSVPAKTPPGKQDIVNFVKEKSSTNSWQAGYEYAYQEIWEALQSELN